MKYLLTVLALFLYLNLDAQNLEAKEIYIHYNDSIYRISDIIKQVEENKYTIDTTKRTKNILFIRKLKCKCDCNTEHFLKEYGVKR